MTKRRFDFLARRFGHERVQPQADRDDVAVGYADGRTRVTIVLQGGHAIVVYVALLEEGSEPEPFDAQLRLRDTKYSLEDLVPLYDSTWSPPTKRRAVNTADDLDEVLSLYADALSRHGGEALAGSPEIFARLASAKRRRLVAEYADGWSQFVDHVCEGFAGSVVEYVEGINDRAQLHTFLNNWEGDRRSDPIDRIEAADERFFACTEPLKFRYGEKWQLLPMPTARDWWRRPTVLTGALRRYFVERAADPSNK